jgi:hypothetical protein
MDAGYLVFPYGQPQRAACQPAKMSTSVLP